MWTTQRHAVEQAAKKKIEKYGAAAANIDFVPLAVDSFGCWCEAGEKFLRLVATRCGRSREGQTSMSTPFRISSEPKPIILCGTLRNNSLWQRGRCTGSCACTGRRRC